MCRKLGAKSTSGTAKFRPGKMAAPLELSCWGGGWGLPSVHSESLVVMVRTPCGPGPRKEGGGATGERLDGPGTGGLQQFPIALLAAPLWPPCSLQMSYNLACDSTAAWRETRSFSTWLWVILSLSKPCGRWSVSSKQGACVPRSASLPLPPRPAMP